MLTKMEKQIIQNRVNNILMENNLENPQNGYIDIVKFATHIGFQVGESKKLMDYDDGFIYISEDQKTRIIGVNYNRTLEEKRFIVAHELAHYYLHYDHKTKEAFMRREHVKGKNEKENDADFFAACFLMPKNNFINYFNEFKKEEKDIYNLVDLLQSLYKTPRESIIRRIKEVES